MFPFCHPSLAKPDVERWTLGDTRQWAESVVGLSALDASRVTFCGAQLSTYPTSDLLEDLGEAGLGAAGCSKLESREITLGEADSSVLALVTVTQLGANKKMLSPTRS